MFTGIIEELGEVESYQIDSVSFRIRINASITTSDIADGDSIAVNGVCLTALETSPTGFSADASRETLSRTTLGLLKPGMRVNLERAVTPTTRFGGHIVQGHVDARGTLVSAVPQGDFRTVKIGYPPDLARYLIEKGSVAVDGISLTIAALADNDFDIAVIPKTWEMTNLSTLNSGDAVNLEVDPIAKYVERLLSTGAATTGAATTGAPTTGAASVPPATPR